MGVIKKIGDFELKHKILFFNLTVLLTILISRIVVLIHDPNPFLFGYELHHFYYGLVLLIIINLFMLFGHRNYKIHLILSGIGIGLILDELLFVIGKLDNSSYSSTMLSALLFFLVIAVISVIIGKFFRKKND